MVRLNLVKFIDMEGETDQKQKLRRRHNEPVDANSVCKYITME